MKLDVLEDEVTLSFFFYEKKFALKIPIIKENINEKINCLSLSIRRLITRMNLFVTTSIKNKRQMKCIKNDTEEVFKENQKLKLNADKIETIIDKKMKLLKSNFTHVVVLLLILNFLLVFSSVSRFPSW